ncbi:helix-turn-helix transcriptional regulator [Pyrococcus abyssi]|uniref:DUF7343 domain-containing protein n=1 Tax=Pyrococcus abyssi (strain GE5 / Orsay) TaxID=272844 RepID=Q9V012_PYRAB|nr:winged helix-turn-helix transcriptional regulator [Pyrococcus abyssi]CAB49894.1 Hypothetical protein PAB0661 [Pyrococcus abyssi GE5]CCE70392.1 TPA: hypothetical protein PAB0661 [Pyrococcus abyssi GE5]
MNKIIPLCLFTLLLVGLSGSVSAYIVEKTEIYVWEDNSVTVSETIIPEDYEVLIRVPTIGVPKDILVISNEGKLIGYTVGDGYIEIEPLDATKLKLIYTVMNYTRREGGVWVLRLAYNDSPVILRFPNDAIIVSVSDLPIMYNSSSLILGPGNVTVYYTLKSALQVEHASHKGKIKLIFILGIIGVMAVILKLRSGKEKKERYSEDELRRLAKKYNLNDDELNAIKYLISVGGKCKQAELRRALNLPKTTVWRMVRRLEQMGLVKLYKVGRENWVELTIDMQKYA